MPTLRPSLYWLSGSAAALPIAAGLALAITAGADHWGKYIAALALLVGASLLRAALQWRATVSGHRAALRAKAPWRNRAIQVLIDRAPGARITLGDDIATATDRVEDLDDYHARFLPLRMAAGLAPLLIAAAVACASWVSGIILLATLVPFAFGMILAGTAASRAASAQMEALGRLSGLFIDRIRNLPLIASYHGQDRIGRHLGDATREVAERTMAVLKVAFLSSAVLEFFSALSVALVAVYCGFSLLGLLPFPAPEALTLDEALFVLVLAPEFYLPMRRLAAAYHDKQKGEAALERLESFDSPVEAADGPPEIVLPAPPALSLGQIVIDHGDTRVGPFDLDIRPGVMTAIMGPTGSGKSSILHALLGLAPLADGRILLDGERMPATGLRGAVSWTGQTTALLPGSIRDNIRLASPGATDRDVEAAAQDAGLSGLLASRAEGLDLLLDPRGSGLSGGERRRIALARAFLRDAPLWLLDEPTADLDAASAATMMENIVNASHGRTVLIVTHDLLVAQAAACRITLS